MEVQWWHIDRKQTMFVDSLHSLQHVLPVKLPLQGIYSFAVSHPSVQIQVTTLHEHIDIAVGYLAVNTFTSTLLFQVEKLDCI